MRDHEILRQAGGKTGCLEPPFPRAYGRTRRKRAGITPGEEDAAVGDHQGPVGDRQPGLGHQQKRQGPLGVEADQLAVIGAQLAVGHQHAELGFPPSLRGRLRRDENTMPGPSEVQGRI